MKNLAPIALSATLLSCGFSAAASAGESSGWRYELTPYFLAAGLDGKAGVHGVTADIDMSFSDIWDDLDMGLMGLFTADKGRWGFWLEGVYFKLNDKDAKSVSGPFGQVNVNGSLKLTTSMYVYQGSVAYQLLDGPTRLDLVAAVRYTELDADAKVAIATTPAIEFPGGATSATGSDEWADGVVGFRVAHPVSRHVDLVGYADVGGGGSDLTYQFLAGANWAFKERFTAKAGYRYLYWDYDHKGTVWDMVASGPYLGLGIAF